MTKLLDIRLTSCIIDGGSAFGKNSSHHYISCTCNRCLIKQHIATFELLCLNEIHITFLILYKLCAQALKTKEMGIKTTTTNLVTTRFGYCSFTKASQERTYHQDTTPKGRAFLYKLSTIEILQVEFIALEGIVALGILLYLHPN